MLVRQSAVLTSTFQLQFSAIAVFVCLAVTLPPQPPVTYRMSSSLREATGAKSGRKNRELTVVGAGSRTG